MDAVALIQSVLSWFAKHAQYEDLALQCRSAHVTDIEHVGNALVVQVATSAPFSRQLVHFVENRPSVVRQVPGPLISSPTFPNGASVRLYLQRGYISELEIVANGSASFPTDGFSFTLSNEPH